MYALCMYILSIRHDVFACACVRIIPILAFTFAFGRAHAHAHVSAWRRACAHSHHACSDATRARSMLPRRACATQTHDQERADPVTTAWQVMLQ